MNEQLKLPVEVLFVVLLTLVGPIKMLPTFDGLTLEMSAKERRTLAVRGTAYALLGVILAAFMGDAQLSKVGISPAALGTAAGLILTLVGLMPLIGVEGRAAVARGPLTALSLAFPILLPPYAFGIIILFSLYARSLVDTAAIIVAAAVLLAFDLAAMLFARPIMAKLGMTPFLLFGAAFGIIQLALGIQILSWGVSNGITGA